MVIPRADPGNRKPATQGVWGSDDDCRAYRSYGIQAAGRGAAGLPHVEFREAAAEALPFPDADFDVAISNGVLNLIPGKPAAFAEIFRVLKPVGASRCVTWGSPARRLPPTNPPGPTELPAPWRGRSSSLTSPSPGGTVAPTRVRGLRSSVPRRGEALACASNS